MKNILALVGALVVVFVVAGWYLGWYQFGTDPTTHKIKVEVDADKVKQDEQKAVDYLKHKNVEGQQTSFKIDPSVIPDASSLPPPPSIPAGELYGPDGKVKVIPLPPPPMFPGQ